jgi:hypothetical protein
MLALPEDLTEREKWKRQYKEKWDEYLGLVEAIPAPEPLGPEIDLESRIAHARRRELFQSERRVAYKAAHARIEEMKKSVWSDTKTKFEAEDFARGEWEFRARAGTAQGDSPLAKIFNVVVDCEEPKETQPDIIAAWLLKRWPTKPILYVKDMMQRVQKEAPELGPFEKRTFETALSKAYPRPSTRKIRNADFD